MVQRGQTGRSNQLKVKGLNGAQMERPLFDRNDPVRL